VYSSIKYCLAGKLSLPQRLENDENFRNLSFLLLLKRRIYRTAKISRSQSKRNKELKMNKGIQTVIYPVKDLDKAKSLFRELLGVEPYADAPYYVGFKVGGQDIGLDPHSHTEGMTAYYHVDDIQKSLKLLVDGGATTIQEVKDVGGGRLIASVKDENGNIIGLVQ
jgi:predicted enzyme related to lactoylglutathione lyase